MKAIKARNEYVLALEATNASVFKYYIHDLSDLIDVSITGYPEFSHHVYAQMIIANYLITLV